MTPVIEQTVSFNATPAILYQLFMNSAKHTAATGMLGGMILGKNLVLIPNRMIAQTWRSSEWKKKDPDSILVVTFEKSASGGAQVALVHVGVPEYDHKCVTHGWVKFYWEPWKKYLALNKR
jgi:activator of HSP90 ATPase